MNGILINPFKKTVTEIEIGNSLDDVYSALTNLDIGFVNMVERLPIVGQEDLWVDEEGLYKAHQKVFCFPPCGFTPIRGKALILGVNDHGDSWGSTTLAIELVYKTIIWES